MNRRKILKLSTLGLSGLITSQLALSKSNHQNNNKDIKKKVLVLGGTGFLGPVLVQELIDRGHEVTLFNRGISNPHLFPQLKRLVGDRELEDKKGLGQLINSKQHWDWVVDTWQKSPKAVLDAVQILKNKVNHYQYVSTISVYDDWNKINITEKAALNPVPEMPRDIATEYRYAIRKTLSEMAIRKEMPKNSSFFRSHGLRSQSKRQGSKSEPYWQVKLLRGGKTVMPLDADYYQVTDMKSLAKFMVHCGEQQHTGPFNVAYEPFKFKKFIEKLRKVLNSEAELFWLPQDFLTENNAAIFKTEPKGRYRFSVDRAVEHGLVNRTIESLCLDQIKGYMTRHPGDDFVFGEPGTYSLSKKQELELIKKWLLWNK